MKFEQPEQLEVSREKGFDPEGLVEEKDWESLNEKITESRKDENWTEFFALAGKAIKAFPEKASELNIYEEDVSTRAWSQAETQLDAYKGERSWEKFFSLASGMGSVFGERVQSLKDRGILDEKAEEELKARLDEDKSESSWLSFFRDIDKAKTLFPEMLGDVDIEDNINEIKENINKRKKPGKWGFFCEQAAGLESLGYDVEVKDEDWEKIKDDFEHSKSSNSEDWVTFASSIKSLKK